MLAVDGRWDESAFVLAAVDLAETETRCNSCRRRPAVVRPEEAVALCDHCRAEALLGALLPRSRYLVYYPDGQGSQPAPIGSFRLLKDVRFEDSDVTYAVDLDGQGVGPDHLPLVAAFRSRYVPRDGATDRVYEFSELALRSQGRPLLAVLKMDADNLGYIFGQALRTLSPAGQGPEGSSAAKANLARLAGLSRTLELFFGGYLDRLLRDRYPGVYLVYSGGDDLVAIGPWNVIFDLAVEIREEFRRFTGGNPAWTLSAGVAVINPHVPVLVAVAEAEEALENPKSAPGSGVLPCPLSGPLTGTAQKNRITAFDTSIPWDQFPAVLAQAKQLAQWIAGDVLSTSQVRRLLWYAQLARQYYRDGNTQHLQ